MTVTSQINCDNLCFKKRVQRASTNMQRHIAIHDTMQQQTITCPKSTKEALEPGVKYVLVS